MKMFNVNVLLIIACCSFVFGLGEYGAHSNLDVLVKVKDEQGKSYAKMLAKNIRVEKNNFNYLGLTVSPEAIEIMKDSQHIESVSIDHKLFALEEKGGETVPWGIKTVLQDIDFWENLNIEDAEPVKLCIADTGYDITHEDLPDGYVNGTDGYGESWSTDGNNHGTHTSGTAAAVGGNNIGVYGVFPNNEGGLFELLIGKALSSDGVGSSSGTLAAVQGCVDLGANVVSMSLGCNNCYTEIENDFYEDLYGKGVLIVAAAGNSANSDFSYPASYKSVISVAALDDSEGTVAYYSQFNSQVEISAPGTSVYSTIPNNKYDYYSGTSMATPHVSAVAGLIWMHFPNCTNKEIRNVLADSARTIATNFIGCDEHSGFGLLQAQDAYQLLSNGYCTGTIEDLSSPKGGCCQKSSYYEACIKVTIKLASTDPAEISWYIANSTILFSGGDSYKRKVGSYTSSGSVTTNQSYVFNLDVGAGDAYGTYKVEVGDGTTLFGTLETSKSFKFYVNTPQKQDTPFSDKLLSQT